MHIICPICSDVFVPASIVTGTSCGHLFHHECLIQWLERSKSCPQCRAISNEKSICRIYFNIPNSSTEDTNTLQNKVDSLEFQLLLKNTELKKCKEEIVSYKTKTTGLKGEVKRLKMEIKSAEANHTILKEQFNILKKRNNDLEPVMQRCESLQKEVQFLRNIETVIKGTSDEVDEMLNDYGVSSESTKSLLTYTSVLKKEMQVTASKKKELSSKLRESESKVLSLTAQVRRLQKELASQQELNSHLLVDIDHAAEEHKGLVQKVQALEQAMVSPSASHPSASALKRLLAESPAPVSLKRACPTSNTSEIVLATSPDAVPAPAREESPYLNIKSSSIGLTPLRPSQTNNLKTNKFSIFRSSRVNTLSDSAAPSREEEEYDGMGGHSKPDAFPRPVPLMKIKKIDKHQRFSKIKLKDASHTLKIDMFLRK